MNDLSGELIRARRRELGISERELANRLGVSITVIAGLERGTNHDDQPFSLIRKLAVALSADLSELTADVAATHLSDAEQVGAMLHSEGRLTPVTALAEASGWDLNRTHAAVDALEQQLPLVGLRLHRLRGDVSIVPAMAAPPATRTLARRMISRRGLDLTQAKLLHRIASGDPVKVTGNADRVALSQLLNAGLVEDPAGQSRRSTPALSEDVRFSLEMGNR